MRVAGSIPVHFIAGVAQLVEHFLAKEDVASSSLVTRSTLSQTPLPEGFLFFQPRPLFPENVQVITKVITRPPVSTPVHRRFRALPDKKNSALTLPPAGEEHPNLCRPL